MWELDCEESWVPKNWCFWTVVLDKTLENPLDCKEMLGGIGGRRRRGQQRMRWLDGITNSMHVSLSELWEFWRAAIHGVTKSWTRLSDCTELNWTEKSLHRNSHLHLGVLENDPCNSNDEKSKCKHNLKSKYYKLLKPRGMFSELSGP